MVPDRLWSDLVSVSVDVRACLDLSAPVVRQLVRHRRAQRDAPVAAEPQAEGCLACGREHVRRAGEAELAVTRTEHEGVALYLGEVEGDVRVHSMQVPAGALGAAGGVGHYLLLGGDDDLAVVVRQPMLGLADERGPSGVGALD